MQITDVTDKVKSQLSTMKDWEAFDECMELGSYNREEVEPDDYCWECKALHEDPENLPYEEEFPYFERTIYIHRIYFLKFPDHLQFQDGRVLLMEPEEDGRRELRPETDLDTETYLMWAERDGKFFIEEYF